MIVKYSEIRSKLDTGDVFLFSASFLISRAIQLFTHSAYSHIGMVARYPDASGSLCFWEATSFKQLVDKSDHEMHAGVRLVSLEKVLSLYSQFVPGGFSMRLLKADRTEDFRQAFFNYVKTADARPMANGLVMGWHYAAGRMFSLPSSDEKMFCSQLLAETYQRLGLLPADRPPNAYAPKHFSMQNPGLPLLSGAELSEEMLVVWDGVATAAAS